jgi:hypothetical protein
MNTFVQLSEKVEFYWVPCMAARLSAASGMNWCQRLMPRIVPQHKNCQCYAPGAGRGLAWR